MERKPIRIQQGNDCLLKMLPKMVDGTPVPAYLLSDIEIKLNATTVTEWAIEGDYITIPLPESQPLGTYDITLTAKIGDRDVRDCRTALFCRVPNGDGIPYEEYCSEFTIITVTDEELEALKQAAMAAKSDYDTAHAEAVAARDAYIAKTESLDGVAKETKATENKEEILRKIGQIPAPDLSSVAKEQTLLDGVRDIERKIEQIPTPDLSSVAKESTLQGVSGKVGTFTDPTETVAHKLENLTFDKTDLAKESTTAKQGSNPNISLTSLDAKLGNVVMGTDSEFEQSLEYINSQLV